MRFVWIPKNGGTSIEQTLRAAADGGSKLDGVCMRLMFGSAAITLDGHYPLDEPAEAFAVCRNPYSRAVSLYYASGGHTAWDFATWIKNHTETGLAWRVERYAHNLLCPQVDYVADWSRCEVLRFESINSDWAAFCDRHGLPCRELQHQKNNPNTDNWRAFYDQVTANRVFDHYAKDFATFGYHRSTASFSS